MLRSLDLLLKLNAQFYKDSTLLNLQWHVFKCSEISLLDKMVQETRDVHFIAFTCDNLNVHLKQR